MTLVRALGASTILVACASATSSPPPSPKRAPVPVAPVPASAPVAAAADAGAKVAHPGRRACPAPGPGEISDDESPRVQGVSGDVDVLAWLEARGVARAASLDFFRRRYAPTAQPDYVAGLYSGLRGGTLTVGDRAEEAVVAHPAVMNSIVEQHAVLLVVRGDKPVPVLDVGVALVAMDFAETRWLELALVFASGGRSVELRDRAPNGTKLVLRPSECRAREDQLDACEVAFAREPDPELLSERQPHGWRSIAYRGCTLVRGPDGRLVVDRRSASLDHTAGETVLRDCAGGRAPLLEMQRSFADATAGLRAQARAAVSFFDKSCAQRGTWTWKGDRFVKGP